MKILTGLFRMARKRTQTKDGTEDFRASLTALVDERESLTDEGIGKKVDELKAMITDLPDSEDKEKLSRYLDDFRAVKEQDEATAKEAVNMVAGLYESLDSSASADAPNVKETADENSEAEKAVEETETKDEETATEEKKNEETKDEGGEEKRYSLDEIFEMIKTLKDGCKDEGEKVEEKKDEETKDEGEKVEEKKDEETKDEGGEVTEDHAPMIPMNISNSSAKGSLSELFANMKKGGR